MTFYGKFLSFQEVELIDVERKEIILSFPANDCITAISHEISV